MPVGGARATALAPPGTPRQPRHLRRQARLVDEDRPGRIEVELAVKPGLALSQDLRPLLLQCVRGFFVREAAPAQPVVQRAPANPDVALVREAHHHLIERDVLVSLNHAHDEAFMPTKARPASTTGRSRLHPHRLWLAISSGSRSMAPHRTAPPHHAPTGPPAMPSKYEPADRHSMLVPSRNSLSGDLQSDLHHSVTSQSIQ